MSNNKGQSDEIKEAIHTQNELEDIINDMDVGNNLDDLNTDILPDDNNTSFMDFDTVQKECKDEAEKIISSIVNYYLDPRMKIANAVTTRYLEKRMDTDILTISNLLFNMETSEHAIKKLLEEIDAGNLHPRQFEVLASLQKSKMDIVKHLQFVQIQLENNYKLIRQEFSSLHAGIIDDDNDTSISSKGLLKQLRKRSQNNDDFIIEDN